MCKWGGDYERKGSDSLSGILLTLVEFLSKYKDLGVISREYYNNRDPERREKMKGQYEPGHHTYIMYLLLLSRQESRFNSVHRS